ncbi:hypothetical protein A3A39_02950 [Candidatus Kaiserbacteria bacterium RIFCSPLOWO2_01_FULL_54_13]|uniref:Uncharacterized protein n=1 Tax=Candidatus Kaiserbacteria bacterium RIFCSPLOWO2_01_FULL_54_13 TaxID=1798512 RepID=A0A1F6F2Z0_9BACT|nr:MAG: hypothetical protein A3A39_02950 [Candidatus Kaiserbacteria bacterium RIFCSPLOWO2_01_FULL_54_13]
MNSSIVPPGAITAAQMEEAMRWTALCLLMFVASSALAAETSKPSRLEAIPGSDLKRVILTAKAAELLAIETDVVREESLTRVSAANAVNTPEEVRTQRVVPYSAVIYDPHGNTWVFTNPEPLVYVRHRIEIGYIKSDRAVLKEGPSPGTAVVTVGASILMGIEQKFGQ